MKKNTNKTFVKLKFFINTSVGEKRKARPPLLGGRPMIKENPKMKHAERNFVLGREKRVLGF